MDGSRITSWTLLFPAIQLFELFKMTLKHTLLSIGIAGTNREVQLYILNHQKKFIIWIILCNKLQYEKFGLSLWPQILFLLKIFT